LLFFFQAEDGIRDRNVTGVQTCALPISTSSGLAGPWATFTRISGLIDTPNRQYLSRIAWIFSAAAAVLDSAIAAARAVLSAGLRSEERRVGKDGGCGRVSGVWTKARVE